MNFPGNIKALRKYRGWSQEQVAGMLAMKSSTYSAWENGATQPSLEWLNKLQELYGVGADILLRADLKGYGRHEMAVFVSSNLVQPRPRIVKP